MHGVALREEERGCFEEGRRSPVIDFVKIRKMMDISVSFIAMQPTCCEYVLCHELFVSECDTLHSL